MDLGQVSWNGGTSSRLFIISAGTGLDALVCKKALQSKMKVFLNRLHLGKLTYLFLTVQSLFTMRTADAAIRFLDQKEKQKNREKMIFAAAMNLPAEGGGVPMSPEADAFDGRLSVCQAWGIPKWRTFLCLPFLVAAKHANLKGFSIVDCKSCEVHLSEPMELHTDGECCGEVDEMRFDALPGKLRVLK